MLVLIINLFGGFNNSTYAQTPPCTLNHAGRDFWLTGNKIGLYSTFYITGKTDAHITFRYNANGATHQYFLQGGTVLRIIMSAADIHSFDNVPIETVHSKSLHISSDEDIVVHYANVNGSDDDGILLYPSNNQTYGNEFYLNAPRIVNFGMDGDFSIVSRCDSVVLEITPSANTIMHPANVPFTVLLQRGEGFLLGQVFNVYDLSGTRIKVIKASCQNPINIFLSYGITYMTWPYSNLSNSCCADQLMEQLLPVNLWDKTYPMAKFYNNPYVMVDVESASDNNTVYFDGVPQFVLNKGEGYDTIVKNHVITADSAISVTQQMMSLTEVCPNYINFPVVPFDSISEPASMLLLPLKNGITETYFQSVVNLPSGTPLSPLFRVCVNSHLMLLSTSSNVASITLNGTSVSSQFVPMPNTPGYMYAHILLDTALTYHLLSNDRIAAYYYGTYLFGSLAYPLGDVKAVALCDTLISYDTLSICLHDSLTLVADSADAYVWSNGSLDRSIRVGDSGTYVVRKYYADSCETIFKNYRVSVRQPDLAVMQDTILYRTCVIDSIQIVADPADMYTWSDGSHNQSFTATQEGIYKVERLIKNDCKLLIQYYRFEIAQFDTLYTYDTLYKCLHENVVLQASAADSFNWSNGATTASIEVSTTGLYHVMEANTTECRRVMHQFAVLIEPVTDFNLGHDTTICPGDRITLTGIDETTRWSDGSTGEKLSVDQAGLYWAETMDTCTGIWLRDTIAIDDSVCMKNFCTMSFPTAFTPDHNGKNDVFRAVSFGEFTTYTLLVFNRWGELIFRTYQVDEGWDGTYKGQPADVGVYFYLCTYQCRLRGDRTFQLKGDITLLR